MITGIIMASGYSKRMGKNKLLLKINGESLIEKVIRAVCKSRVDDIIVIYRDNDVKLIADKYKVTTVYNSSAKEGQSAAIKLGLKTANVNSKGYMFFVADQPFLNSEIINEIIKEYIKDYSKIILPLYNGTKGNPTIFPSCFRVNLLELEGDMGGRKIIVDNPSRVKYIKIDNNHAGKDIDTWDEYLYLQKYDE